MPRTRPITGVVDKARGLHQLHLRRRQQPHVGECLRFHRPRNLQAHAQSYAYGHGGAAYRAEIGAGAGLGETTTYDYDNQGNLLSVTKTRTGHLHATVYTYDDALNRRATVKTDPYSGITTYGYDDNDNVVSVKDPLNLTTTYTYDGLGNNLSVISPDTGTTTKSYNALGLVLTTTDARGKSASYQYDALNRTTTVSYSGGQTISYLYDTTTYGTGHLTKMTDPAGTTSWTYNQFGDVLTRSQTTGALSLTTTYTYDADERLSTIKYPSTKVITYSYDTSGRISALSTGASDGRLLPLRPGHQSWTEQNTVTYARTFDQDGRITSIAVGGTTTLNVQTHHLRHRQPHHRAHGDRRLHRGQQELRL